MVNHGDPDLDDVWILDGALWYEGPFHSCPSCNVEVATMTRLLHGAVSDAAALPLTDDRVLQGIDRARKLASTSYSTVPWHHGIFDRDLVSINEWLGRFEALKPLTSFELGDQSDSLGEELNLRQEQISLALVEGNRKFSRRLVAHAVASLAEEDPDRLDWRLEEILRGP